MAIIDITIMKVQVKNTLKNLTNATNEEVDPIIDGMTYTEMKNFISIYCV